MRAPWTLCAGTQRLSPASQVGAPPAPCHPCSLTVQAVGCGGRPSVPAAIVHLYSSSEAAPLSLAIVSSMFFVCARPFCTWHSAADCRPPPSLGLPSPLRVPCAAAVGAPRNSWPARGAQGLVPRCIGCVPGSLSSHCVLCVPAGLALAAHRPCVRSPAGLLPVVYAGLAYSLPPTAALVQQAAAVWLSAAWVGAQPYCLSPLLADPLSARRMASLHCWLDAADALSPAAATLHSVEPSGACAATNLTTLQLLVWRCSGRKEHLSPSPAPASLQQAGVAAPSAVPSSTCTC